MPKKKSTAKTNGLSKAASKNLSKPRTATTGTVFQLKIALNDIRPPIWRRVQTKDCTLANLHDIIQVSMGWQESHLHLFQIGEDRRCRHWRWCRRRGWRWRRLGRWRR